MSDKMLTVKRDSKQLESLAVQYASEIPVYAWDRIKEAAEAGKGECRIRLAKSTSSTFLVDTLQAFLGTCDSLRMMECGKSHKKPPYIPTDRFKSRKMIVEISGAGLIRNFAENFRKYGIE